MKRKHSTEVEITFPNKMSKIAVENMNDSSMIVASGSNVMSSLARHFNYELSDSKARSNILRSATREALDRTEKQKCTMIDFSAGAYLEVVSPTILNCNHQLFLFDKVINHGSPTVVSSCPRLFENLVFSDSHD